MSSVLVLFALTLTGGTDCGLLHFQPEGATGCGTDFKRANVIQMMDCAQEICSNFFGEAVLLSESDQYVLVGSSYGCKMVTNYKPTYTPNGMLCVGEYSSPAPTPYVVPTPEPSECESLTFTEHWYPDPCGMDELPLDVITLNKCKQHLCDKELNSSDIAVGEDTSYVLSGNGSGCGISFNSSLLPTVRVCMSYTTPATPIPPGGLPITPTPATKLDAGCSLLEFSRVSLGSDCAAGWVRANVLQMMNCHTEICNIIEDPAVVTGVTPQYALVGSRYGCEVLWRYTYNYMASGSLCVRERTSFPPPSPTASPTNEPSSCTDIPFKSRTYQEGCLDGEYAASVVVMNSCKEYLCSLIVDTRITVGGRHPTGWVVGESNAYTLFGDSQNGCVVEYNSAYSPSMVLCIVGDVDATPSPTLEPAIWSTATPGTKAPILSPTQIPARLPTASPGTKSPDSSTPAPTMTPKPATNSTPNPYSPPTTPSPNYSCTSHFFISQGYCPMGYVLGSFYQLNLCSQALCDNMDYGGVVAGQDPTQKLFGHKFGCVILPAGHALDNGTSPTLSFCQYVTPEPSHAQGGDGHGSPINSEDGEDGDGGSAADNSNDNRIAAGSAEEDYGNFSPHSDNSSVILIVCLSSGGLLLVVLGMFIVLHLRQSTPTPASHTHHQNEQILTLEMEDQSMEPAI